MKDKLGGEIMSSFAGLRSKTYSYLIDDENSDKKAESTTKCVTNGKLKFNNYKNCLLNNEIKLKSQQRSKSKAHNIYTEEIHIIPLSSNHHNILQTFDKIN